MTASVSSEIAPNALRQPSASPSSVPSGTPSDRAMGAPTPATASARPLSGSATSRRA